MNLKKLILWVGIFFVGSLSILLFTGVSDFSEFEAKKDALLFGVFIGLMAAYIPKLMIGQEKK